MKKIYRVVIEEIISDEFEIEAETKEDAISKAISKYKSGEIILEPGNLESKKISVENDEWIEF